MTHNALRQITSLSLLCTALLLSSSAVARPTYPPSVPKSAELGADLGTQCLICHFSAGGGGSRNAFGIAAGNNKNGGFPDWSALYALDSDGDGFTNGEELCDPMGTWRRNSADPDPTCTPTDPSDPDSKPASNNEPMDMGGNEPMDMGGNEPMDMGGNEPADMDVTPPADMNTTPPPADMDTTQPTPDMSSESDMGGGGQTTPPPTTQEDDDEGGCAQAGSKNTPASGGASLLAALGLLAWRRRRRS